MSSAKVFDFPLLKDDVTLLVQEAVLSHLEGNAYDHKKVNDWVNNVTAACTDDLRQLSPCELHVFAAHTAVVRTQQHFKFIVTCFIRQRKGAGLEFHSGALWDEKADGACIVSWENPTMSVVVAVYGVAITSSSLP